MPEIKYMEPMVPSKFEYFGSDTYDQERLTIFKNQENPVKILAKFQGDWMDELDTAVSLATKAEYTPSEFHPEYLYVVPLFKHPGKMPKLEKMARLLGFEKLSISNVQMQRPGCVISKHTDPAEQFENPKHKQVIITLTAGEHGQILGFNNHIVSHWEPGTVMYTDYPNVWHFTANASWHTRPILLIAGEINDTFQSLLDNNEPTIFQL